MKKVSSNQLKAGVALSYLSTALNVLVQLVYTPLMIRILGQNEYGLYTSVGSLVAYLSFFSLGFTGAYLRFYSQRSERNDAQGVARLNGLFLTLFVLMGLLAFICGMVLAQFPSQLFGNKLTNQELVTAKILMQILVVNIAVAFPSSLLDAMISAREKFLFQRCLSIAAVICNPLLALPLLWMGYGSIAVVATTTFITVVKLIINVAYCAKVLHVRYLLDKFDFPVLKEIAGFSFFLFLHMIIDQINWSVDKFILGWVSGTTAVAIYGVGAQINTAVISFSSTISSVFAPRVNRIAARHEASMNQQFTEILIRVGRIQYLVLMLIASGFVVFGHYFIINIYSTVEYSEAYPVALLLILPSLPPLIQDLGIEIQRSVNKHRFRATVCFFMALFNVAISIPLAYEFGPCGSALGTAIGQVLANTIIMNVYYQKRLGLHMTEFWKSIISLSKGLVIPAIIGIIIMRWAMHVSFSMYVFLILVYSCVYVCSMWFIGMNEEERQLFSRLLRRFHKPE